MRAAFAAVVLLAAATPAAAQAVRADLCKSPAHHAFDFWIGRWTVTETKTGKPAGQSLIEQAGQLRFGLMDVHLDRHDHIMD